MRLIICLLFISFVTSSYSQRESIHRTLPSSRSTLIKKLDGVLSPGEWSDASIIEDYTEFKPQPGNKEEEHKKTLTYLAYNNEGIYFAGKCFEENRADISAELAGRDGFGNNDFVGIIFDTYKDNQNGFEYFVTPLNEQMDAKNSASLDNGEDFSWNAVWYSATSIQEDHWSFEMFIPFSAIRFSKKQSQDWGLNITRRRQKTGEQYMWNPVWPDVNGFLTQEGYWTGLEDIRPPLRLQFSPYLSYYVNHHPAPSATASLTNQINGGVDMKWGINQAFTLDATLVPDFGQVQSDNQVLNLTPFEVRFNENRPFFTEGTELFNKGNFFYSRRIGGNPYYFHSISNSLQEKEILTKNPVETKLINASKLSGRTENGWGVGILNALSGAQYATIEHVETRAQREILSNPLTNYNVLVLDKTLKNNSSITLINTSVLRAGSAHEAIVTAGLFDLNDRTNTWNVGGKIAQSQLVSGKAIGGYSHLIYAGKKSGRFNFNINQELTDTKFSSNDLGYFTNNNYLNHSIWMRYRWIDPGKWYNTLNLNLSLYTSHLFKPIGHNNPAYQSSEISTNINGQLKNLWWAGMFYRYTPGTNDYYEPRVAGRYFRDPQSMVFGAWFETNSNKKYSANAEAIMRYYFNFFERRSYEVNLFQNYRFNQRFSLSLGISLQPKYDNIGFSYLMDNDPIFARRNVHTTINTLSVKYSFTNRMGLTFRARHYSSNLVNQQFFYLTKNGSLSPMAESGTDNSRSVNFFNIDMVYTWQFAQGSFINLVWKDAIAHLSDETRGDYWETLGNTLNQDQNNNLSLKIIYFLDMAGTKAHRGQTR